MGDVAVEHGVDRPDEPDAAAEAAFDRYDIVAEPARANWVVVAGDDAVLDAELSDVLREYALIEAPNHAVSDGHALAIVDADANAGAVHAVEHRAAEIELDAVRRNLDQRRVRPLAGIAGVSVWRQRFGAGYLHSENSLRAAVYRAFVQQSTNEFGNTGCA